MKESETITHGTDSIFRFQNISRVCVWKDVQTSSIKKRVWKDLTITVINFCFLFLFFESKRLRWFSLRFNIIINWRLTEIVRPKLKSGGHRFNPSSWWWWFLWLMRRFKWSLREGRWWIKLMRIRIQIMRSGEFWLMSWIESWMGFWIHLYWIGSEGWSRSEGWSWSEKRIMLQLLELKEVMLDSKQLCSFDWIDFLRLASMYLKDDED